MEKEIGQDAKRYIQIGLKIAYYRKLNGMTQDQLAELLNINPKYLSQVESPSKAQPISLKMLFRAADIFHIPPHRLLEFED